MAVINRSAAFAEDITAWRRDLHRHPELGLHHPGFDFNDRVAPVGASVFARLVERAQPPG
ncbi:hypothetical protein [Roseovarius sp.]|jgi:metal-dependent amidase/aminoacylase/carboxypeptidase family protein